MIPPKSNIKWKDLVCGKTKFSFDSLALRILMGRVLQSTKNDMSPQNIDKSISELYDFFVKNEKIVNKDLEKIFG